MKKKVLLFLTVFVLSACLFAFAVSANSINSDEAEQGTDLFTCLGFAIDDNNGSMCIEYNVDLDALKDYEAKIGTKLNYGLVIANGNSVKDNKPLDSGGNPTGNGIYAIALNTEERTAIISVIITGLDETTFGNEFVLSLYVQENDVVKYVNDEETSETTVPTSYNKIKDLDDDISGDIVAPETPFEPEIPVGPIEVTVGGIVYSTDGVTEPAWDRIRQQNSSLADYNTGSHYTYDEIHGKKNFLGFRSGGIISKAKLIITGGSVLGLNNAADFMSHYLGNTGNDYNLDVQKFLNSDSGAMDSRNEAINNALRASEMIAKEGETYTINQLTENHPMQNTLSDDWKYSLGSYFTDVDVINLTVTEVNGVKTYSADIKYIVTDFYNWDTNDYYEFKKVVSPHDLHELHKAGAAKEFMTYGEYTYKNVTWTEGQVATEIPGLN